MKLIAGGEIVGKRVDSWAAGSLGLSRSRACELLEKAALKLNGMKVKPGKRVAAGDVLAGEVPAAAAPALEADERRVPVVFRDRHLAVVDKPAGLTVHPGAGVSSGTLVNRLLGMRLKLAPAGGRLRPGIVHRLDRDTSGLMVVALSDEAYWKLVPLVASHRIEREYLVLVSGTPSPKRGTIKAALSRNLRRRERFEVVSSGGRPAVTHYETVESFSRASLVKVRLETGRTHQIRVHFAACGWPVLGDRTYAPSSARAALSRQALHSARLAFHHPVTGRRVEFSSPLPADMAGLLEDQRRGLKGRGT